jgi:hypothetical protein
VRPLLFLLAILATSPAQAAAVRCRLEHDVLVAPAELMGVAGDYIIDTGQAASVLAETQAQAAGFDGQQARGGARFAGQARPDLTVAIADLDARTYAFETPIAGVIGEDVLAGYIVDIRFAPCWIALWPPGAEPRFRPTVRRDIALRDGAPLVDAAVSDGLTARRVSLRLSTGLDAAVRLSADFAGAPGTPVLGKLLPNGPNRASLRALSFAGDLFENVAAGLEGQDGVEGSLGAAVLARYRVRLDLQHSRLSLAPR